MIEIFDNVLGTNKYDQEISHLKWSYEYQPITPPLLNKHWYSDGKPFIDDLFKDLVGSIQLEGFRFTLSPLLTFLATLMGWSNKPIMTLVTSP